MVRVERKRDARERILDVASRRLRSDGISGAAIAPIMREAGLTHGAFYAHFGSKAEFAAESFAHAIRRGRGNWLGEAVDGTWLGRLKRLAAGYLTRSHRDHPEAGCAFATAVCESGRAGEDFRSVYEAELRETLEGICSPFHDPDNDVGRRMDDAVTLMALCVGGLALSRAVVDEELSDRILRACRTSVATRIKDQGDVA